MHIKHKTSGVCALEIEYDYNNEIVTNIKFLGGCPGNLQMISKLLDGKSKDEIIKLCSGNICRGKNTSCADQLAKSLQKVQEEGNLV